MNGPGQQDFAGITGAATSANAAKITAAVTAVQAAITKLNALDGPSALTSIRDTFVTESNAQIAAMQAAATAASSGDSAGYQAAFTKVGALDNSSNAAGSQLGAPDCA